MKNLIRTLFVVIIITSLTIFMGCKADKKKVMVHGLDIELVSKAYLSPTVEKMNAKYIGMEMLDTVYIDEQVRKDIAYYSEELPNKEENLMKVETIIAGATAALKKNPNDNKTMETLKIAEDQKANIHKSEKMVNELTKELAGLPKGVIKHYEVLMKYEKKNEEGARVPQNYTLLINAEGKIFSAKPVTD